MLDADVATLIRQHSRLVGAVRARAVRATTNLWDRLPNYDRPSIALWARQVAPVMEGSQRAVAVLTDTHLAEVEQTVTGRRPRVTGVPASLSTTEHLRGVTAVEVLERSGVTVWRALANGVPWVDAVNRGLDRGQEAVVTNIQLARTHTTQRFYTSSQRVVGYRRVINSTNACALCIVASTQRYHREDLSPIHPGCSCSTVAIYGDRDPGRVLSTTALGDVRGAIEERFGSTDVNGDDPARYRDVLVTHQHGELGPVLAVRGQHFQPPT